MTRTTIYVVHEYGAERHFVGLDRAARRHGRQVRYLVLGPARPVKQAWVRRTLAPVQAWIRGWIEIVRLLRSSGSTVVIGIAPFGRWIWFLERLAARHAVVYFTSWPAWEPGDPAPHRSSNAGARARWLRALRGVSAVGVSKAATAALRRLGADASAIPHAVDTAVFAPGVRRPASGGIEFLFVGRLVEEKGVNDLLEAFDVVAREHPSARLTVVGDGPLAATVRRAAVANARVRFLGRLTGQALVDAYQGADVMVVPSRRRGPRDPGEIFGIVMVEAFACGVPVLAYDGVGPREVVVPGGIGEVLVDATPKGLAAAMERWIARPDALAAMGVAAREEALRRYALDRVADAWLERLASVEASARAVSHRG